jgi:hypothetical protein
LVEELQDLRTVAHLDIQCGREGKTNKRLEDDTASLGVAGDTLAIWTLTEFSLYTDVNCRGGVVDKSELTNPIWTFR